jgi:hypothetical protein
VRDLKKSPEDWVKAFLTAEGWPSIDGKALLDNPAMVPGFNNVRLNVPGRTLVLEYDPAVWSPEWLDELMTSDDPVRIRSLMDRTAKKFLKLVRQN